MGLTSIVRVVRELLCERCDLEYPVWYTPDHAAWNKVAAARPDRSTALSNAPELWHFLCPECFLVEAARIGLDNPPVTVVN